MPFAVELGFDDNTENYVRKLWNEIKSLVPNNLMPVSENHPHITVAVFNNVDKNELISITKNFIKNIKSFPVQLCGIGNFPQTDVVFLSPLVNSQLLDFHKKYHKNIEHFNNQWEYYLPDKWMPHCTVSLETGISEVPKVIDYLSNNFVKQFGKIERICLIEFNPIKIIWEQKINGS